MDISATHQRTLNEAELPGEREELSLAGAALLKAITAPLPPGLDKLSAVTEQKRRLDKLKAKFSVIVARHLNNLFIHLVIFGAIFNILFLFLNNTIQLHV